MAWQLDSDRPIYAQLVERIQMQIVSGCYEPGGRLPSVRELAATAAVNPNTMQRALGELERQGLLVSAGTSGRYVTDDKEVLGQLRTQRLAELAKQCAAQFAVYGLSPREAAALLERLEE